MICKILPLIFKPINRVIIIIIIFQDHIKRQCQRIHLKKGKPFNNLSLSQDQIDFIKSLELLPN